MHFLYLIDYTYFILHTHLLCNLTKPLLSLRFQRFKKTFPQHFPQILLRKCKALHFSTDPHLSLQKENKKAHPGQHAMAEK